MKRYIYAILLVAIALLSCPVIRDAIADENSARIISTAFYDEGESSFDGSGTFSQRCPAGCRRRRPRGQ